MRGLLSKLPNRLYSAMVSTDFSSFNDFIHSVVRQSGFVRTLRVIETEAMVAMKKTTETLLGFLLRMEGLLREYIWSLRMDVSVRNELMYGMIKDFEVRLVRSSIDVMAIDDRGLARELQREQILTLGALRQKVEVEQDKLAQLKYLQSLRMPVSDTFEIDEIPSFLSNINAVRANAGKSREGRNDANRAELDELVARMKSLETNIRQQNVFLSQGENFASDAIRDEVRSEDVLVNVSNNDDMRMQGVAKPGQNRKATFQNDRAFGRERWNDHNQNTDRQHQQDRQFGDRRKYNERHQNVYRQQVNVPQQWSDNRQQVPIRQFNNASWYDERQHMPNQQFDRQFNNPQQWSESRHSAPGQQFNGQSQQWYDGRQHFPDQQFNSPQRFADNHPNRSNSLNQGLGAVRHSPSNYRSENDLRPNNVPVYQGNVMSATELRHRSYQKN